MTIRYRSKAQQATCKHTFVIPPPSGTRLTVGQCHKCGAKREHHNSIATTNNPWRPARKPIS